MDPLLCFSLFFLSSVWSLPAPVSFPSIFYFAGYDDVVVDSSSARAFVTGSTSSSQEAIAVVSLQNFSFLASGDFSALLLDDASKEFYAVMRLGDASTELSLLGTAANGSLTKQNSLVIFGSPTIFYWAVPSQTMLVITDTYNAGCQAFHFSFVDVKNWQVTLTTTTSLPLFCIDWGGSWLSAYDPELGILLAATGNNGLVFQVISTAPLAVVRTVNTTFTQRSNVPCFFIVVGTIRYFLYFLSVPHAFLLVNYTSLADLQDTSRPLYQLIQHSTYQSYSSCVYLDSLQYIVCSTTDNNKQLDFYAFPSMRFIKSFSTPVNDLYLGVDRSSSILWAMSANRTRVSLRFFDLSQELCAEDELPTMMQTPENATVPNCVACTPGRFVSEIHPVPIIDDLVARSCQACPIATYSANSSSGNCTVCPAGTFNPAPGASACRECLPGSELVSSNGSSAICECKAGYKFSRYLDDSSVLCDRCPLKQFKAAAGNEQCDPCPFGSSGGGTICTCDPTYYMSLEQNICLPCYPEGAECHDNIVYLLAGYWRPDVHSSPITCRPAEACRGGADYSLVNGTESALISTCGMGYEGPICGVCSEGFSKNSGISRCVRCTSPSLVFWIPTIVMAFVFALYYVVVASKAQRRVQRNFLAMSLAVSYVQYLAQLTIPSLTGVSFSFLELQPALFSGDVCPFPGDTLSIWGVQVFSLFFVLVLVALFTVLMVHVDSKGFRDDWRTRFAFSCLGVTGFLFIGQAKHLFLVLLCRDLGDERVLYLDPSTRCGSAIHVVLCVISILGLLALCVGLPLVQWLAVGGPNPDTKPGAVLAKLLRYPTEKIKNMRIDFTFLVAPFNSDTNWWEALWSLRRASVVIISSLTPFSYAARAWIMALSVLVWLACHVYFSPLRNPKTERMETVILAVLFCSFTLEVAYYLEFFSLAVAGALLIILNAPCLVYVFVTLTIGLVQVARNLVTGEWRRDQDTIALETGGGGEDTDAVATPKDVPHSPSSSSSPPPSYPATSSSSTASSFILP